jgi:hypothetical protein
MSTTNLDRLTEQALKYVSTHKKTVAVVPLAFIILFGATAYGLNALNIVNPGVEGAKSGCWGVNILNSQYHPQAGFNTIHFVGANENPIAYSGATGWSLTGGPSQLGEAYVWGPGTGVSQMTVQHFKKQYYASGTTIQENQISTDVESNIQLQDFNYVKNSIPLNQSVTSSDPTQVRYLQYWTLVPTNNPDGTITYNYTTKDILLVPGDFHLEVFIPPSTDYANTGSGWEEGTWSNINLWYTLYWYDWLNSLGQVGARDYLSNQFIPPDIPANALNRTQLFNYRGGYPISAWIQDYYMLFQSKTGQVYDMLKVNVASSNDHSSTAYSAYPGTDSEIPSDVYGTLVGMVTNGFQPSLRGHYLDLYTQPNETFNYVNLAPSNATDVGTSRAAFLDAETQPPQQYFKIGVLGFGTVWRATGWFGSGPFKVYYPSVNYLVRVIMGVYGSHTLVWTTSTASSLGYTGWQDRTVVITVGGSGINWPSYNWADLFSPLNLEFFAIALIAIVILVTIFNPGVWASIFSGRNKAESRPGRSKPKRPRR